MVLNPYIGTDIEIKGRQLERAKQTLDFIGLREYGIVTVNLCGHSFTCTSRNAGRVLSIGEPSSFDKWILEHIKFDSANNTVGDLDADWNAPDARFDTVFCFEVLEHLTNPRLFLENLREYVNEDTRIYISVPNHLLRRHWRSVHYHEIDKMRMEYLFNITGYEIVRYQVKRLYPRVSEITGIRPLLRYITGYSWFISRTDRHFYRIRKIQK